MADSIKLAVLGGSGVATPELVDTLAEASERPAVRVALIGRSADKLEAVGAMCRRLAARASPPITISTHTDPREGLDGADYVLNQIRVGGYQARAFDETFPREFGIPGEETVGPGGMNMALRTIPVVLDLCRAVEAVAPEALVLNLTNPASMVQYAINCDTSLKVISLCDLPMMAEQIVADLLGIPQGEMVMRYSGMNHFGWVTSVIWHKAEWMPALLDKISQLPDFPVAPEIVRSLGVVPTSYFKYLYHPNWMLAAQQGKPARAEELLNLEREILAAYESGNPTEKPAVLVRRGAAWYKHMIVPVLLAHAGNTGEIHYLQVINGNALPFLPERAIVEVPCVVRRSKISPLAYKGGAPYDLSLPLDLQALLLANAAMEMLWVEAIIQRSYAKALRAMLMNPLVSNYDQARGILNKIWPDQEQ